MREFKIKPLEPMSKEEIQYQESLVSLVCDIEEQFEQWELDTNTQDIDSRLSYT